MRNLPASVKARWWAGCRGPPCWQAQDGWPQRLWTKVESGSKDGAFRRHLLQAAVDHALDDGRLARDVHSNPRGSLVYSNYTRKSAKNHGCEEKIANRGKQVTQDQSKLRLAQLQRCDKSLVPQSCPRQPPKPPTFTRWPDRYNRGIQCGHHPRVMKVPHPGVMPSTPGGERHRAGDLAGIPPPSIRQHPGRHDRGAAGLSYNAVLLAKSLVLKRLRADLAGFVDI